MTTVVRPLHFVRQGKRTKAVSAPKAAKPARPARVPRVARLMALAIEFEKMLRKGDVGDHSELARLCNVTQPRMTQIMNLLHLAPDVQEALLFLPPVVHGHDPITERHLRHICGRQSWSSQRKAWRSFLGRLNTDASTDRTDVGASLRNSNRN